MRSALTAWRLPAVGQIGSDQLSALLRATPAALACGLVNAAILSASLWHAASHAALFTWLTFLLLVTGGMYFRQREGRAREVAALSRRALRRTVLGAIVSALPWAMLPILYLGHLPHNAELVLITVCAGMAAGGSVVLAPVYPAAIAYVAAILGAFAFKCFWLLGARYGLLGMLSVSYCAFLFAVIATAARLSVERTEALRALTRSEQMLKERDAIISNQSMRFETALNNMTQGLCFFDSDERLIVCNKRYVEIYGLDPERVRPGTLLSDILDMRYEVGSCPRMSKEDYLAWRSKVGGAAQASETTYEMDDGRIFAIRYRPMADGAWVATTDDVTERQKLTRQLAENHKLLAGRTSLLQAIVDHFPGGIAFFDSELRIAIFNDQAKALLDVPESFFAHGPPRLRDMIRFHAERGDYGPGDIEQQIAAKMSPFKGRAPFAYERSCANGTMLEVRGTPLEDGGFIATFLDITERHSTEVRIAHMATHDALTALPNRVLLRQRLDEALGAAGHGKGGVAVLMLDLNRFKQVNDTLGHPMGDELLRSVAKRLSDCVRSEDTVARLGGDEFAIVVRNFDPVAEAASIADRVQAALTAPFTLGAHTVHIGTSIGISICIGSSGDADDLIRQADVALYRAKAGGDRRYCFFEDGADAGDSPNVGPAHLRAVS